MTDAGEQADSSSQVAAGDADTRVAALFEHATLVAQLRAAVGRRLPHPQVEPEDTVPWDALIEAAVCEPESVDQSLVASIAERLGRKTDLADGDHFPPEPIEPGPGEAEPDVLPAAQFAEFVKSLIVGTGLAKLREMWRLRRTPRE